MSTSPKPEVVGKHVSKWGEGPVWYGNRLLYVDIEGHKVISFDPVTSTETVWDVGQRVGTVVGREKGGLVFAGDKGFYFLDELSGDSTAISDPEAEIKDTRFNDGKCDPTGRFWAGTMDLRSPRQPIGGLYCLEPDLRVTKKLSDVACSNGIVWTKDGATMYYIDTPRKNVLAFDFDQTSGEISEERVAFTTEKFSGNPDGMTIDANDHLWIAFVHSSTVRCIDPENGEVLEEVVVPAREVTACAFGGSALDELYITTGTPGDEVEPQAGRLFMVKPGVRGVPAKGFAG